MVSMKELRKGYKFKMAICWSERQRKRARKQGVKERVRK